MKKVVFLDLDGVLADFDGAVANPVWDPPEMFVPGFFRNLKVMPGAHEAVSKLLANPGLDVYIGSKPSTKNFWSSIEKYEWVSEHFPKLLRRIVLVCDKSLLRGDVLVDDDKERWGHKFKGTFIHFDRKNPQWSWNEVVKQLEELCKHISLSQQVENLSKECIFLREEVKRYEELNNIQYGQWQLQNLEIAALKEQLEN